MRHHPPARGHSGWPETPSPHSYKSLTTSPKPVFWEPAARAHAHTPPLTNPEPKTQLQCPHAPSRRAPKPRRDLQPTVTHDPGRAAVWEEPHALRSQRPGPAPQTPPGTSPTRPLYILAMRRCFVIASSFSPASESCVIKKQECDTFPRTRI